MTEFYDINNIKGLTEQEALHRHETEGLNEIPSSRRRSTFKIVLEILREPMFLLLIACGSLYLFTGESTEAYMLLGFVFVVMGITIIQERRTEKALEALKDLSSPRALVVRDGIQRKIAGREVVRGDIIVLAEGDRVPADSIVRYSINFYADESLLTGESIAVRKTATLDNISIPRPGGENLPFIFSGTLVTKGQCVAEVQNIGMKSELGRIGKALETVETEDTPLQKETGKLVKNLAIVGLTLCVIVVVVYALVRGGTVNLWKEGLLAGLALAMATLPEEFPVVLTIFLAMGAWRISKSRVLTRRMPAVETLGSATVLCVDKTGTLTQNKMSISKLFANNQFFDANNLSNHNLPENFHQLVEYGILASKKDPFDPMEKALRELGTKFLNNTEHLHENWGLAHEYPLSEKLLALSHVWKSPDGKNIMIAAKGAPEAIADLCHFEQSRLSQISEQVSKMANEGLRVLGVARGWTHQQTDLPKEQHDFEFEFLGLVGLADPIRETVPVSIKECYTAGIRVIMITGDYPGTAQNIAKQIGLKKYQDILTGHEIEQMSDEILREKIKDINIIARAIPEHKLRIVNALKANGEVVAMTGDGVNDAPALKAAHIGIAMGGRGTDVAREASSLVLLDDDFSSIVRAVKLGRRIFDNIKKAISYICAVHIPIAGLSLVPVFFKDWPLILLPVHIVFLELIIDPSCTMIFEAEGAEDDIMSRPPRNPNERLFSWKSLSISLLQGLFVLLVVLGVYVATRYLDKNEDNARGLTFASLVVANLCLILTNRAWSRTIVSMMKVPNSAFWWVIGGTVVFLAVIIYTPFLRSLFHFAPMHFIDILICIAAGITSVIWFELFKVFKLSKKPI